MSRIYIIETDTAFYFSYLLFKLVKNAKTHDWYMCAIEMNNVY